MVRAHGGRLTAPRGPLKRRAHESRVLRVRRKLSHLPSFTAFISVFFLRDKAEVPYEVRASEATPVRQAESVESMCVEVRRTNRKRNGAYFRKGCSLRIMEYVRNEGDGKK